MKIALAQVRCVPGQISRNIEHAATYIERAKAQRADIVILPELVDTGYSMTEVAKHACPWPGGAFGDFQKLAQKHEVVLVVGLSERVGDSIYNSLVVFDGPNVRRYRKIHLFSPTEENKVFEPGSEFLVTEYQGTKIGFMTCYDLRFPEMARSLALMGASIIVVIAAFPLPRIHHWHTLLQARAIENQCVMVAVNRVGTDEGITFGGSSCVIHPTGTWIDRANPSDEELIVQELRIDLSQARSSIPVFVDRRPDLYNLLTSI